MGDGDRKSYTEASKMALYGPAVFTPKEECIAHDTKRMRTALRKLYINTQGRANI